MFLDSDDLVPMIDSLMPEVWFGVDLDKYPYLHELSNSLTSTIAVGTPRTGDIEDPFYCPVTSENFVDIKFNRLRLLPQKGKPASEAVPDIEELSVKQLLKSKYKNILLTGEAGSGKSTALRRMVCIAAEQSIKSSNDVAIPILLRAKELGDTADKLEALLASKTIEISGRDHPAFDYKDLTNGNVLIFVDGLDEVPRQATRENVLMLLSDFGDKYEYVRILLSSRNYSWLQNLPSINRWVQFRISPIDWRQTKKIVRRLRRGRSIPQAQMQEILRRLQDVHGLQLNPLIVSVFVASSDYSRRDIPANITEIIKKYTELMIGRWDTTKGVSQQYQAPLKDFLLKKVAGQMHRNKITSVSLKDLEKYLEDELRERGQEADINDLVEEIVYRSGLFRVIGDQVEFAHLMLQEFFAGRDLSEEELLTFINEDWWSRAIVFYFGENPNSVEKLKDLAEYLIQLGGEERNVGLLTVGLSLQACYLVRVAEKVNIYVKLITMLAEYSNHQLNEIDSTGKTPLLPFVFSYLMYRDAVSCDVQKIAEKPIKEQLAIAIDESNSSAAEYWQLVGLLECGEFSSFYKRLKDFKAEDNRMFLALHLGAYFYRELRTLEKAVRRKLNVILKYLDPKVKSLRVQLRSEVTSELLEIRKGKIKAIEDKNYKNR